MQPGRPRDRVGRRRDSAGDEHRPVMPSADARAFQVGLLAGPVHAVAIAPLTYLPFALGALVTHAQMPPGRAAWVATVEVGTMATFTVLLATVKSSRGAWLALGGGLLAICVASLAGVVAQDRVLATRSVCGAGAAMAAWGLQRILATHSSHPAASYGGMVSVATLVLAGVGAVLPFAVERRGAAGLAAVSAVLAALGLAAVAGLRALSEPGQSRGPVIGKQALAWNSMLPCAAFAVGVGLVWVFAERYLTRAGLTVALVAVWLTVANLVSALAPLAIGRLATRWPVWNVTSAALLVTGAGLWCLAGAGSPVVAVFGLVAYLTAGTLAFPALMTIATLRDPSGHTAAALPGVFLGGVALGAILAGALVRITGDPGTAGSFAATSIALAALLVWRAGAWRNVDV
jgi:hypothetical protein